jgi:AcrR family transcriptional regulator
MGRRRVHDESTAAALLTAAEDLLQEGGPAALSLRQVAGRAETSVQAVYSVFGSKEALLGALGANAMELLRTGVSALPATANPRDDLVEAALVFRRFALTHPALFEVAFHGVDPEVWPRFSTETAAALQTLKQRFQRLADAGLLGRRSLIEAVAAFDALCEGMAILELRRRLASEFDQEQLWRDSFTALLSGFAT